MVLFPIKVQIPWETCSSLMGYLAHINMMFYVVGVRCCFNILIEITYKKRKTKAKEILMNSLLTKEIKTFND